MAAVLAELRPPASDWGVELKQLAEGPPFCVAMRALNSVPAVEGKTDTDNQYQTRTETESIGKRGKENKEKGCESWSPVPVAVNWSRG
ncbi:UNVERIFIED_CONTAM: hypothetical protein Sradi_0704400 [Sesamum radiatum]|uniref:Uncharacterized protein n=1 Tax=Sesamum radiatum TaxID=300843 RepID=A0AAW2VP78_SESRA